MFQSTVYSKSRCLEERAVEQILSHCLEGLLSIDDELTDVLLRVLGSWMMKLRSCMNGKIVAGLRALQFRG